VNAPGTSGPAAITGHQPEHGGTGKLSNQRALRADPYIEDAEATGIIGLDETAIRPEVLWNALTWAGVHVGIGASRKMAKAASPSPPL